ncbi:BRISC and BRCA1-A complex member 1 [Hippoglossus hippoglossus]|uniref:BRISC and BRCA1-A complex member 1 n=1 Tax=Hippoglossus hippoglossus TaxID=8267 RepID=UPI00148CE977|nr:BRISC and BRCA1-A complex member 1 [Hippoglossus hippoglossus]XP_034439074.1 BRISC and BRCA1-A complex member 1 [Hippoglossus hippoglossus]XP_034439075.1 BRISC and BRCA1-A complex member 1 [Hippoglossus hippoglossus]
METPEPGPADGEERLVELRPRTRSNPEGAEDRRSSTGSLGGNSNPNISQPAVGSRVEGEGEASTSDSPPSSTTTTVSTAAAQTVVPPAAAVAAATGAAAPLSTVAAAAKERPKPTQQQPALTASVPPPAEYQLRVPRVNCPEKVIICLDLSEEMSLPKLESFNGSKANALNISQKMIEMFVRTKHKIDKRHEFALVVVNDDALWLSGFTSDPRELCSCLYDLETNMCESFNLEDLLNVIRQKIELPLMENVQTIPPPYVVRTVLIYSRQAGQLQFNPSEAVSKMLQSPYFFFDVVYLHNGVEEQGEDTSWRDNYTSFCNLDSKGVCYHFEVSLSGPAIELHNCMAKLLAHPLQRPFQSHASYSLLEGDDPQDIEATV